MNGVRDEIPLQSVDCPLCGGKSSRVVVAMPDVWYGIPGQFTVVHCHGCGHEYMNPQPVRDALQRCYPGVYEPHGAVEPPSQEAPPKPWWLRVLPLAKIPGLKRLVRWLSDDRSQPVPAAPTDAADRSTRPRAIELGCAGGGYLRRLTRAGWDAEGVELCEEPARAAQAAGLRVHCGTLESAEFPEAEFDLAAAWMVLEHVPDPLATLRELRRLLRDGGQLLLSVPHARCWQRFVFGRCWYGWDVPRHLQQFSPATLGRVLDKAGFRDVQITHQRTLLSLLGSIGIRLRGWRFARRLAEWCFRYPDQPRQLVQLLLAPPAILLSWLRQGERLTVSAIASAAASKAAAVAESAPMAETARGQTPRAGESEREQR